MTDDVRNLDSAETTQFYAADETAAIDPDALELEDPDDTGEASDADSPRRPANATCGESRST